MFRVLNVCMVIAFSYGYSIVPRDMTVLKPPLYFFPAQLKNSVPQELYHTFVDHLKKDYDVKVDVTEINESNNFNKEILLLSHSSGANQLMNVYENLNETVNKKAVLIDPLDFQKYSFSVFPSFPKNINIDLDLEEIDQSLKNVFEKDYVEELKNYIFHNEDNNENTHNNKILILNHKKSDEWKILPLIPPINALKM